MLKFANFDEFEKVTNSATVCNCGTNRQTTPTWITEYTDSSAADIVAPGARIDPCLIPEDVMKAADRPFLIRTLTVSVTVSVWRSYINYSRKGGIPVLGMAFQRATLSTESKVAFMSM